MWVLLDTHTLIWFIAGDPSLYMAAMSAVREPTNDVRVSAATLWEMPIKYGLGKFRLSAPPGSYIPRHLHANNIAVLNIELRHIFRSGQLPQHGRDPFDRMLVAQALVERWPIVSCDAAPDAYRVTRVW